MLKAKALRTSPEPVANGLPTVESLLPCFRAWLAAQRDESKALVVLRALASESAKRAASPDPQQLEFDAVALAQACGWQDSEEFDLATSRIKSANLEKYLSSRATDLRAFFMQQGHDHALTLRKRSPPGRHRAQWFLAPQALEPSIAILEAQPADEPVEEGSVVDGGSITYDYAAAGTVKPSWLARLLFGNGRFKTKSLRGLLFAGTALTPMICIAALALVVWMMLFLKRPVTTGDLAFFVFAAGLAWALSDFVRNFWWLLADRITPASEVLLAWGEESAQLECFKEGDARIIGIVRFSAVCTVCAAAVELRYGEGNERRRIFGCCVEAPQDHVFTFDRVTRRGTRIR